MMANQLKQLMLDKKLKKAETFFFMTTKPQAEKVISSATLNAA